MKSCFINGMIALCQIVICFASGWILGNTSQHYLIRLHFQKVWIKAFPVFKTPSMIVDIQRQFYMVKYALRWNHRTMKRPGWGNILPWRTKLIFIYPHGFNQKRWKVTLRNAHPVHIRAKFNFTNSFVFRLHKIETLLHSLAV